MIKTELAPLQALAIDLEFLQELDIRIDTHTPRATKEDNCNFARWTLKLRSLLFQMRLTRLENSRSMGPVEKADDGNDSAEGVHDGKL